MTGSEISLQPAALMEFLTMKDQQRNRWRESNFPFQSLVRRLEFVLINDEARSEWCSQIEACTGTPDGIPWDCARYRILIVLTDGLSVLQGPELCRLGLDSKSIRRWSEQILDILTGVWWQTLLVHGRMMSSNNPLR